MTIREGKKEDLPRALELIKELADYEKAPDEVTNTVEQMEKDGFGDNPIYGIFVAENDNQEIVGIAIYYYRYSTWKGKRIYLEDIVVTESERGKGTGKLLFDRIIQQGKKTECSGMVWQVLDWNEPAINFYKKYYSATLDGEWINCSISFSEIS
ncbi:GNAT family N-acetyltransferase [Fulvivirga sp. 29W222]|uniref:GNAT family N-acetyltransferase n=1 Tax=Fulvivirga marina TaxID=2494733 RepID=A0A937KBF1_9BACT|nr:GNAT family N-acetyltransferase [Fulvivirga marina]MBL6446821.1 GNAT family N-acetyltransferase [Fulvivirga marina]